MKHSDQQIQNLFQQMPPEVQKVVVAVDTFDKLKHGYEKYQLSQAHREVIGGLVGQVLLGIIPPEQFKNALNKQIPDISDSIADQFSRYLSDTIFDPAQDKIEQAREKAQEHEMVLTKEDIDKWEPSAGSKETRSTPKPADEEAEEVVHFASQAPQKPTLSAPPTPPPKPPSRTKQSSELKEPGVSKQPADEEKPSSQPSRGNHSTDKTPAESSPPNSSVDKDSKSIGELTTKAPKEDISEPAERLSEEKPESETVADQPEKEKVAEEKPAEPTDEKSESPIAESDNLQNKENQISTAPTLKDKVGAEAIGEEDEKKPEPPTLDSEPSEPQSLQEAVEMKKQGRRPPDRDSILRSIEDPLAENEDDELISSLEEGEDEEY